MKCSNKKYKIDAVHCIFKRIVKFGLSEVEKDELLKELIEAGYEPENIIVGIQKP
jgi:hypothetical protein